MPVIWADDCRVDVIRSIDNNRFILAYYLGEELMQTHDENYEIDNVVNKTNKSAYPLTRLPSIDNFITCNVHKRLACATNLSKKYYLSSVEAQVITTTAWGHKTELTTLPARIKRL